MPSRRRLQALLLWLRPGWVQRSVPHLTEKTGTGRAISEGSRVARSSRTPSSIGSKCCSGILCEVRAAAPWRETLPPRKASSGALRIGRATIIQGLASLQHAHMNKEAVGCRPSSPTPHVHREIASCARCEALGTPPALKCNSACKHLLMCTTRPR